MGTGGSVGRHLRPIALVAKRWFTRLHRESGIVNCAMEQPHCTCWTRIVTFALALLLAACGALPSQVDRSPSFARRAGDSALGRIAANSTPDAAQTGFRLMPMGSYSLDARIQLARRAQDTLDLQYYLVRNDRSGRLLMRNLRDAAVRGVRVRLLLDDLYTAGNDAMFLGLAAFPNVEVRLFNPFCCARETLAGKYLASINDFTRLNHRMHNKLFVADGAVAVMGGRNIGDEYFTRSETNNFVDMDVLAVGAAVSMLSTIFDRYWNSPQAYPVTSVIQRLSNPEEWRRNFDRLVDDGDQITGVDLAPVDILGYGPVSEDLDAGRLGLVWGKAVVFADHPGKVTAVSIEQARAMSVQMDVMDRVMSSKSDVVISSPYFVPGSKGVREFGELRNRGVKVDILTNSFAATDEPLVHIGYSRYRSELLRAGVDLYELSPTRIRLNERVSLPGQSLGRLHAKAAVIDQSTVYIGSMNLDPRSDSTNTELGLIAACPELAREIIRVLEISRKKSSYHVRFASDNRALEWLAIEDGGEVVLSAEPEVSLWMRVRNLLLGPFVPEQLL
jgi:putative cardiolipin synthase